MGAYWNSISRSTAVSVAVIATYLARSSSLFPRTCFPSHPLLIKVQPPQLPASGAPFPSLVSQGIMTLFERLELQNQQLGSAREGQKEGGTVGGPSQVIQNVEGTALVIMADAFKYDSALAEVGVHRYINTLPTQANLSVGLAVQAAATGAVLLVLTYCPLVPRSHLCLHTRDVQVILQP